MANKTQKEFRKQMKELEKEGKIPDNYYARRRIKYGYSISAYIVIAIIILFRFNVLQSLYYMVFNRDSYYQDQYYDDYYYEEETPTYIETNSTDYINTLKDVTIKVENHFFKNQTTVKDVFETNKKLLDYMYQNANDSYESEDVISFAQATIDINNFALDNYDKPLTQENKSELEDLIKKAKDISFSLNSSIIN